MIEQIEHGMLEIILHFCTETDIVRATKEVLMMDFCNRFTRKRNRNL